MQNKKDNSKTLCLRITITETPDALRPPHFLMRSAAEAAAAMLSKVLGWAAVNIQIAPLDKLVETTATTDAELLAADDIETLFRARGAKIEGGDDDKAPDAVKPEAPKTSAAAPKRSAPETKLSTMLEGIDLNSLSDINKK